MVILIMSNSFSHHFISMTITNSMNFFLKNPQKTYLLISVYMASYKASKRILFSTVNTFLCMIVSVDDRTEPNLPNTEASVRYYSVRFDSVGYRNTEPNLWGIF